MSQPYLLTGLVVARVQRFAVMQTSAGLFSMDDPTGALTPETRVQINLADPDQKSTTGAVWTVAQSGVYAIATRGAERHVLLLPPGVKLLPRVRITVRPVERFMQPRGVVRGLDELAPDEFGPPEDGPGLAELLPPEERGTIFSSFTQQRGMSRGR